MNDLTAALDGAINATGRKRLAALNCRGESLTPGCALRPAMYRAPRPPAPGSPDFALRMPGAWRLPEGLRIPGYPPVFGKTSRNRSEIVHGVRQMRQGLPQKSSVSFAHPETRILSLCSFHCKEGKEPVHCVNGCSACGNCARICPVHAIAFDSLTIDSTKCKQCGLCAQWCPKGCIEFLPSPFVSTTIGQE